MTSKLEANSYEETAENFSKFKFLICSQVRAYSLVLFFTAHMNILFKISHKNDVRDKE